MQVDGLFSGILPFYARCGIVGNASIGAHTSRVGVESWLADPGTNRPHRHGGNANIDERRTMIFTPEQRREINIMFDGCDPTPDGFQNPYFQRLSREVRLCPCCGAKTTLKPSLNPDYVYERCDRCRYRGMVEAPDPVKMGKKKNSPQAPKRGEVLYFQRRI